MECRLLVRDWLSLLPTAKISGSLSGNPNYEGSALDELHGADRTEEEHGWNHKGMDGEPAESEDGVGHRGPGTM